MQTISQRWPRIQFSTGEKTNRVLRIYIELED